MHPTTPPTPSRRASRAPKNPRRRVRSESDRKKHAGWRHCPRCNRSVSTNGRNFYHHMHKCDRVYFADLIAKVDSAVAPVSTPLPPPVPRVQSSPITPSPPQSTPVKMSEMQRVTFLQQLCFLRVYDRTVDAVLKQIEQTDASICSPAAFEALRRAKGIETQRVFPNPKQLSPPFSPLAPPVHPSQPSQPMRDAFVTAPGIPSTNLPSNNPHLTSQPMASAPVLTSNAGPATPIRESPSTVQNGAHPQQVNTPFSSNGSINATAALPPTGSHPVNHTAPAARVPGTPASAPGSTSMIPQRSIQRHSMPGLSSANGQIAPNMSAPTSAGPVAATPGPERPFMAGNVASNPGTPQPPGIHPHPMQAQNGIPASQQMGYPRNVGNGMHPMPTSATIGMSAAAPSAGNVPAPTPGNQFQGNPGQRDEVMHPRPNLPESHQAFPQSANMGNGHAVPNPSMALPMNPAMANEGNWRRDPQRYSAPAGTTLYAGALYGSSPLSIRPQIPPTTNAASASAAAAANTPVSRVASAMSISSVINS